MAGVAVPVFVGGSVSLRERDRLSAAGAVPVGTDIEAALGRIAKSLAPAAGTSLRPI